MSTPVSAARPSNPRCFGCGGPHLTSACPRHAAKPGANRFASNTAITTAFSKAAPINTNVQITNAMLNRSMSQIPQPTIGSTVNPDYIPPSSYIQNQSNDQFSRKRSKSNGTQFVNGKTENILHLSQDPTKRKLPNMMSSDSDVRRSRVDDGPPVRLSPGQQYVMNRISAGQSVFFTGPAGTGKSFLLQQIIRYADKDESTFVTASTGLAAVNLSGTTIHSFAGIGLGKDSKEDLFNHLTRNAKARERWRTCKMLIVDEVSMIDGDLFDKLEYIARRIRNNVQPFGGIQLVMTGDFLQLPPVVAYGSAAKFAFEASKWPECVPNVIELDMVFRQLDESLVGMLAQVRRGVVTEPARLAFQSCIGRQFDTSDGIEATRLHCKKVQVNEENLVRLNKLSTDSYVYTAFNKGEQPQLDALIKNCPGADVITVKVGAQVMLLKNLDVKGGLVNGSRGVVIAFSTGSEENKTHKQVNKQCCWPIVRFTNGMEQIIEPHTWEVIEKQRELATRTQIPLILAWSLTVHKCQGMTLDRVQLDLSSVFEVGQAYVALSRIRSLNSLSLVSFPVHAIRAHPKALQFYDQLRDKRLISPPQFTPASTISMSTSNGENNHFNAFALNGSQTNTNITTKSESNVMPVKCAAPSQSTSSTFWSSQNRPNTSSQHTVISSVTHIPTHNPYAFGSSQQPKQITNASTLNTNASSSMFTPAVNRSSPAPASSSSDPGEMDVVDLLSDDDDEQLMSKVSTSSPSNVHFTSTQQQNRLHPYFNSQTDSPSSLEREQPLMNGINNTSTTDRDNNDVMMPVTFNNMMCKRHTLMMIALSHDVTRRAEYRCELGCHISISWPELT